MGKIMWQTYLVGILAGISVTLGAKSIIIWVLVVSGVLH